MIVGSILLAFGIDAAWDWRQERTEEREALERIHGELERDRQRLLEPGFQGRAAEAALAVAELIDGLSTGATSVDVPDTLLMALLGDPTFEPRTPGLDALQQSGRISIIRDEEVRTGIANWDRAVTNLFEWEQRARTFVDTQLVLALGQRGDIAHVLRVPIWNQRARRADGGPGPIQWDGADLDGTTRLRVDLELKALVSQRYGEVMVALWGRQQLAVAAEELMASIEASFES